MKEIIEQEIKWCEEHRGMESEVYEEAFIAGLKQVLFFINSMPESEHSDTELDIVLASYRDMFGVKTERANEIHRLACQEVARLRAAEHSVHPTLLTRCPKCNAVAGWHHEACEDYSPEAQSA